MTGEKGRQVRADDLQPYLSQVDQIIRDPEGVRALLVTSCLSEGHEAEDAEKMLDMQVGAP